MKSLNPKSEARNPKQIQRAEIQRRQTSGGMVLGLLFWIRDLFRISDFRFRICHLVTPAAARSLLLWPLIASNTSAAAPIKNSDCLLCHEDKTLFKTNAAHEAISMFVDEGRFKASVHGTNLCANCHSDLKATHPDDNMAARPVNCALCHDQQSRSYTNSVHGLALAAGKPESAGCTDCHGSHDIARPDAPASRLNHANLTTTCGECHAEAARDVRESVHGEAIAAGHREAATCTDCHAEHKIEQLKTISPLKLSEEICSRCHASERINSKYNLPPDRVKTFFESYHGLAAQYGSTRAANCASCHGVHKILPSSDPRSTIHKDHLVQTCGQCHPGATENFASGKIHVDGNGSLAGGTGGLLNLWVRRVYLVLIFGTIGFMLVHNGLAWLKRALVSYRSRERSVPRMNRSQRVQHFTLLISFFALAVTGFALKFPDSWIGRLLGWDENFRRWSHRIAGIILLVAGVYHVCYLLLTADGKRLLKDIFPVKQDLSDLAANARYLAGKGQKPKFGRFGYAEKMEYWAVIWGTIIMGVTGLMIWFKIDVTRFLPRWAVEVATTIHYYEAILACLAIVVWHFYAVIFDPGVYPINWAFWDGRISTHQQQEEHPLEKPELATKSESANGEGASGPPGLAEATARSAGSNTGGNRR